MLTKNDLREMFDEANNEFLKFERVTPRRSQRADLHAFLLLDELVPPPKVASQAGDYCHDMVSAAEHDVIWLYVDCDALAVVVTQEQVVELSRCGVRYDDDVESLALFV